MFALETSRAMRRTAAMFGLALGMTMLGAGEARAHCDTEDGPVVVAAQRALESGALGQALIWVRPQDEAEVRGAFEHARSVRALGPEARRLADRYFHETVVRLHREGEGQPYTGLKPAGAQLDPAVPAADRALVAGSMRELEEMLVDAVRDGLRERFERALAARRFAPGDVEAGRRYVAAYVPLMHYVEGVHALAAGATHGAHR